jgi:predicted Zn-dependent protease
VVLTTGLLWRLQSEAEAAAVVAHLHAHHRLGQVAAALDEPADLAARAAAILAQAQPKPPSAELEVLVAVAAADATHAHAHTDELNADQRAADALVAAGYDRSALRSALARLAPPTAFAKMHPTSPARTAALATLPAGGRVDADRWTREVLARLDRRRGVTLAAATTPTTTTPTTTPTITPTTSAPTTVAPTSTSTPSRPPKKKPTKSPRRAPR